MSLRLTGLTAGLVLLACSPALASPRPGPRPGPRVNPVARENLRPGTAMPTPAGGDAAFQVYAKTTSVLPGGVVPLAVSGPAFAGYRIAIYRLGWYSGRGSRLVACLPTCTSTHAAYPQPIGSPAPGTGLLDANWNTTDVVPIGRRWPSGYYAAHVEPADVSFADGETAFATFVVRAPPRRSSSILLISSVNTPEAYNNWGGSSLYDFNSGGARGVAVSFNRPQRQDDVFRYEWPVIKFFEQRGWDISYATDVDVDRNPFLLLRHRLVAPMGHGEYWTSTERRALEVARDHGVNLAFMGSNTGYWQIRYADDRRTIISYKNSSDPEKGPDDMTIRFRDLGRPECELEGVQFDGGAHTAGDPPLSYTVQPGASQWAGGSQLAAGSAVPGVVGYEWDGISPGCDVPKLTSLFHLDDPHPADAVTYLAPSGARVFATGSMEFGYALGGTASQPANPALAGWMTNFISALL